MFDKLLDIITGSDRLDKFKNSTSILLQLIQYINLIYPKDCDEKREFCDILCKIIQEYKN